MTSHVGPILLAEDDPDLRDAFELALRREGYDVISTGNGLRAVELADEFEPAVVLVELLLPGQSGFQVAHTIKERFGDRVRVLAMSGFTSRPHRAYAEASGAEGFLAKPFSETALLNAIAMVYPVPHAQREPRRKVRIGA